MSNQAEKQSSVEILTVLSSAIEGGKVIMPDAMIAEIVDFQSTTTATDDVPTWYLGNLLWREIDVPLIALEALNNNSFFTQSRALKIIVIHSASYRDKMPYWAFVTLETPRMLRLEAADLTKIDEVDLGNMEVMRAEIAGEVVMILDIEKIEKEVASLLGF